MKNIKNITIKIETDDGKIKIVKNPPTLIICFLEDSLKNLHKKGLKTGKVEFGGLRFQGNRINLMFCFHMIVTRLMNSVGIHEILKTLDLAFNQKVNDAHAQKIFETKIREMNKNKKSNALPN